MPRSSDILAGVYTGKHGKLRAIKTYALIVLVVAMIIVLFFCGEAAQRYFVYKQTRRSGPGQTAVSLTEPVRNIALNTYWSLPRPQSDEALVGSGLPVYDLQLAPKDLHKLQEIAEQVTARTISTGFPREYVPARFRLDGEWVPIKVKNRGLTRMHYLMKRPSLRLKFPSNRLFEGKKQINLSDPYDKGLTIDVTINWELRRHGIMTWDSRFVVLRVNDDVVGLFQEIEQFGRSMADRTGRPEGFIFSGEGQFFGREGQGYDKALAAVNRVMECRGSADSPPAEHCNWAFLREYFDVDKWAWAAAVATLFGSPHAWDPDNLRIFWDPAWGQFEPIPWDYSCFAISPEQHPEGEVNHHGYGLTFYGIPEYRRMRDQRLWALMNGRVDAMIEHANELFRMLTEPLSHDSRHRGIELDRSRHLAFIQQMKDNRKFLTELFRKHDLRASYWADGNGRVTFDLQNHGKSFLEVNNILVADGLDTRLHPLSEPVIVDGIWLGEPGTCRFTASIPPDKQPIGLSVQDKVNGQALSGDDITIIRGDGEPPPVDTHPQPLPLEISIENIRVEKSRVIFGPGRVRLDDTLETPGTHEVIFLPGLEMEMGEGASLIIYDNLTGLGSTESPIRVLGTGAEEPWGAVIVQGTPADRGIVRLTHTIFEGGAGGQNDRTYFTAPFAVHGGVVTLTDCQFKNSQTDDGINLKYCEVDLRDNLFLGSADDAVDLDFCTGDVIRNRVVGAGGDGLDFSGADVVIEQNVLADCADKGMSIGEKSRATISHNTVSDCYTGIAVKDLSSALIRDCRLERLQVGIALYVKKLTFGPSRAKLERVEMIDVATRYVRDAACTLED